LINNRAASLPWNRHDDFRAITATLHCHLCFGYAKSIDALANNRDSLIQLILRNRRAVTGLWRKDYLRSTT
jgi:hypothetical protein